MKHAKTFAIIAGAILATEMVMQSTALGSLGAKVDAEAIKLAPAGHTALAINIGQALVIGAAVTTALVFLKGR